MSKLKIRKINYQDFLKEEENIILSPRKQNLFWKTLARILSSIYLKFYGFKFDKKNSDLSYLKEPCLILMNHIYETDFKIAFKVLGKTKFNIAASRDAFIGRRKLLSKLGCIPVLRFNTDFIFVKTALNCINDLKQSLLIYPESEFIIDGFGLQIPPTFAKMIKLFNVPVLMIRSSGNYNFKPPFTTRKNKSKLSANIKLVLSKEDIKNKSVDEIQNIVSSKFDGYDYYEEAKRLNLKLTNKNRADDYNRVLFKCPHCLKTGCIEGNKNIIRCKECGEEYILNEDYSIINKKGNSIFNSIKEWIIWQKNEVIKELISKEFTSSLKAKIYVYKNHDALYDIDTLADVKYEKDILKVTSKTINFERDLSKCWGVSVNPLRGTINGPTIIVDHNDINYVLVPIDDNGESARIKVAVAESYRLKQHN